ncbi:MAG: class I SAM-dependent methyltransferase family protein [Candidatus Bathyarchaeia archaeon]
MKKRLRKILEERLPPEELAYVYNSYDIIGDIAIVRLNETSRKYGQIIAEAVMKVHRNVRTVLAQISPVYGEFRLRKLEHIAGENKTITVHRESGCLLSVDVEKCYFSPRLFHERLRVSKQVKSGEIVVNMFAGVGAFSIIIAKHSNAGKIYSIDINPAAVKYMHENIRLNRVYGKVIPMEGDAKDIIQERLCHLADRVLMPLPEKAFQYLPYALSALKMDGGYVHYYDFEHADRSEIAVEKVKAKVGGKLEGLSVNFEIPFGRVVRTTGPNWYQIVLDIFVSGKSGKFNKLA